ncbi:MAG: glucose-6-phosphate dehydrogenase [Acidobacteriota bacterium]
MGQENPFEDSLRFERRTPPCAAVIFGANGDLTRRKLIPALYRLARDRRLPPGFAVIGNSRTPLDDAQFREKMREAVGEFSDGEGLDGDMWRTFSNLLCYVPGDMKDPEAYRRIGARLAEAEKRFETGGNVLFYLATQPSQYETAADGIGAAGLAEGKGWRRLVIEKPFGHDLASARELNAHLQRIFPEQQIYRIDHYLGKETVQNILAFRFANGMFEPLWNRRYISNVQITAAEAIGVEGRGAYYEEAGALRDMIQNHLLQVMSTIGMEPAAAYEATAVRDERAKLLRSIRIMKPGEVALNAVAGQYGPARIGEKDEPGFRQEPGVKPDSQTPTYAAVTLFVDNWRWAGVPFYLRTGKRLPRRVTDIAIQYYAAPHAPFEGANGGAMSPNLLIIRIQPDEGISVRFLSKQPGGGMRLRPVSMDFNYGASFGAREPDAYETLLLDAMRGDPTLYIRQDAVEASWAVVEPVLEAWNKQRFDFPNYAAGTWGPAAAGEMLARRGHAWRNP